MDQVRVIIGDTDNTPYGGGTWASRGAGIGGEAALAGRQGAARECPGRRGARCCRPTPATSTSRNGVVVDKGTGRERIALDEVARIVYFRPDTLPPGFQAELVATRHYRAARLAVRLHQRHPGVAISRSTPTPASSSC